MSTNSPTMFHEDVDLNEDNIESDLIDHGSVPGTPGVLESLSQEEPFHAEEEDLYEHSFSSPFYTLPSEDPEATPSQEPKRRRMNSSEEPSSFRDQFGDSSRDLMSKISLEPCPSSASISSLIPSQESSEDQESTTLTTISITPSFITPIKRKRGRPPGKKKLNIISSTTSPLVPLVQFLPVPSIPSSLPPMTWNPSPSPSIEDGTISPGGSTTPLKRGRGRPRKLPIPVQAPGEDWNAYNLRVAASHGPNFKPMDAHLNLPSDIAITNYVIELIKTSNDEHQISLEMMKKKLDDHFHVDFSCRYNFLKEVYYLMYL